MPRGVRSRASSKKVAFASYLRRNQSWPEKRLNHALREKLPWIKFYPQSLVYGFCLDFWIPCCKLCLEIDGAFHQNQWAKDFKRDLILKDKGIKTLRFPAKDVNERLPAVLAIIEQEVRNRMVK